MRTEACHSMHIEDTSPIQEEREMFGHLFLSLLTRKKQQQQKNPALDRIVCLVFKIVS